MNHRFAFALITTVLVLVSGCGRETETPARSAGVGAAMAAWSPEMVAASATLVVMK